MDKFAPANSDLANTPCDPAKASGPGKSFGSSPSSDQLNPGQLVDGRYKILAVIASGGMGCVYKTRNVFTKQIFALKTLHRKAMSETAMLRFRKEAQTASKLDHPNLVRAYDFGSIGNLQPFLVMDYVEGGSLTMLQHAKVEPLSLKAASLGGDFPEAMEQIVAKTLAKDPRNRYQNFSDLGRQLLHLQSGNADGLRLIAVPRVVAGVAAKHGRERSWLEIIAVFILGALTTVLLYQMIVLPRYDSYVKSSHVIGEKTGDDIAVRVSLPVKFYLLVCRQEDFRS